MNSKKPNSKPDWFIKYVLIVDNNEYYREIVITAKTEELAKAQLANRISRQIGVHHIIQSCTKSNKKIKLSTFTNPNNQNTHGKIN